MDSGMSASGNEPMRLFVLVDEGRPKGVFRSSEGAEEYADDQELTATRVYEFKTRPAHPDHLYLMSASWDGEWRFVGEWPDVSPPWKRAPDNLRLDHFKVGGEAVERVRREIWPMRDGLFEEVTPLTTVEAAKTNDPVETYPSSPPGRKARLKPLKAARKEPARGKQENKAPSEGQPVVESRAGKDLSARSPDRKPAKQEPPRPKLTGSRPTPIPHFDPVTAKAPVTKRKTLIPDEPLSEPVEKPPTDQTAVDQETPARDDSEKVKRIWPLKLISPIVLIFVVWSWGVFSELRPPAKTQKVISTSNTLKDAQTLPVEPGYLYFQLQVDPALQQRWARNLGLAPIPRDAAYELPRFSLLESWEQREGFVRPPYSDGEVREWENLHMHSVRTGFFREWPDGSLLILDLQHDRLIGGGWAEAFTSVLN